MKFESKFTRHVLSKLVEKSIEKHVGEPVGVWIEAADFANDEETGEAKLHLDITLGAKTSELYSVLRKFGFA